MATVRKIIDIEAPAERVWDVVRDVGAVHTRFVPGFVTNTVLEEGARVVTFANGYVVRELIVSIDDELRRFAYAAIGGRTTHHNASFEVVATADTRCRLVWTTDVLPDSAAASISTMIEQGSAIMQQTLNRLG